MHEQLYIGLMSGTSMDGVDAVLVHFGDDGRAPQTIASLCLPIEAEMRNCLLALSTAGDNEIERAMILDNKIAQIFATAVKKLLDKSCIKKSNVRAIGSHGQTIRHAPQAATPYTLQIGNPALLAELCGITVVADFRRRDIAAGGQGAPLAPAFHNAFFRRDGLDVIIINIGGIANLTALPAAPEASIMGFDSGPGNALLDTWTQRQIEQPFDRDGKWAASGCINTKLLTHFLSEPYFHIPAPKSTGRELFNSAWLEAHLTAVSNQQIPPQDVAATLVELTAYSIKAACTETLPKARSWIVCGGGIHNKMLMSRLCELAQGIEIKSCADYGINPDDLEAIGFAWLARRALLAEPGNIPSVTGASAARILGGIYQA